eukprot:6411920-Karenia_brevis.AAC.1
MSNYSDEWSGILGAYFTTADDIHSPVVRSSPADLVASFTCDHCDHAPFAMQKALDQHKRISHSIRNP